MIRMELHMILAFDGSTDSTESVFRGDSEFCIHPEGAKKTTGDKKTSQGDCGILVDSTGVHGRGV